MCVTLNWFDEPYEYVSLEQYNEILASLRADPKMEEIPPTKVRRPCFFNETYQVIKLSRSAGEIRVRRDYGAGEESHRYKFQNSQLTAEEQNSGLTGAESYKILDSMFYRKYKVSIFKAFSGEQYKDLYPQLKNCVPPQIHYAVPSKEINEHCFKADVSSAFPAEASLPMPTLKGSMIMQGRVRPTEEFPFAFYLQSHHLAIYDEFDTRELNQCWYEDYYKDRYNDLVDNEEETTLLCPACQYSFAPIMRQLYNGRPEHAENKDVMNKTIGVFHYNGNPRLAHLSAVIIARCVYKMCVRANYLTWEGYKVLHIATDAIIWQGKMSGIVNTGAKDLGRFMLEHADIKTCIRGANCYQYETEDGKVVTKFSGNIPKEERDKMRLGDIWTFEQTRVAFQKYERTEDGYFREVRE